MYNQYSKRKFKVGDQIINVDLRHNSVTLNKVYDVVELDSVGDPYIIDDNGDKNLFFDKHFDLFSGLGDADPRSYKPLQHDSAVGSLADSIHRCSNLYQPENDIFKDYSKLTYIDDEYSNDFWDQYASKPKG